MRGVECLGVKESFLVHEGSGMHHKLSLMPSQSSDE